MSSNTLLALALTLYFWGSFLFVPIRYAVRATKLYREALTTPHLVARVAGQTLKVFVMYCAGCVAGLFGGGWLLGSDASPVVLMICTPIAGWMTIHLLGPFFRMPVEEIMDDKPIVAHRYRVLSQQIVYERAMAAYEAIPSPPPATRKLYELAKADPIYRAALVASYVEAEGRDGWLTLPAKDAKRHESYLDQAPMRRMIVALIAAASLAELYRLIPWSSIAHGEEWKIAVQSIGFFVFGAIYSPDVMPPSWHRQISNYIVLAPVLYFLGGQLGRLAVTALIVAYCWASIMEISAHTQRILDLPSVKKFIETKRMVDQFGSLGRSIADLLTGGAYSKAENLYRLYQFVSVISIFGFSTTLWLRVTGSMLSHMWLSDGGKVYFEHKIRKPQI